MMRTIFLQVALTCLVSLVAASKTPIWGAEFCPAEDFTKLSYDEMKKLLENDDAAVFENAVLENMEDAPSDEEMKEIFLSQKDGKVPDFIRDQGFSLTSNCTSNYNYSYNNMGDVKQFGYSLFKDADSGYTGAFEALDLQIIEGSVGDIKYSAGTVIYKNVDYSKNTSSLSWTESLKAVFLFTMVGMGETYQQNGRHFTYSQGKAQVGCRSVSSVINSLMVLNKTDVFSKSVSEIGASMKPKKTTGQSNLTSITGGTNATFAYETFTDKNRDVKFTCSGILRNSQFEATFSSEASGMVAKDNSEPFSEANMLGLFLLTDIEVGMYLPQA